jgi:hypothetical protein
MTQGERDFTKNVVPNVVPQGERTKLSRDQLPLGRKNCFGKQLFTRGKDLSCLREQLSLKNKFLNV